MLFTSRGQSSPIILKIPENSGDDSDITVEELDYAESYAISSKNNIKEMRKRLRAIFCKEASTMKEEPCYDFFETIYEIQSLEILVEKAPDYFILTYNKNKKYVCSPSLFSFDECLKKSNKHESFSDKLILEEFGVWAHQFRSISVLDDNPEKKNLFLKFEAGFGPLFYKISYPTKLKVNTNQHENIQNGQFFLYLKAVTLFTLVSF